jgi:hypothetical protein
MHFVHVENQQLRIVVPFNEFHGSLDRSLVNGCERISDWNEDFHT